MDLFKLVGTIAIDTAKAEKSLKDVEKQMSDTEESIASGSDKVKKSSDKIGESMKKSGDESESAGKKHKKSGEETEGAGKKAEGSSKKWIEFGKKIESAGSKVAGIGKKIVSAGDAVTKLGKKFTPLSAAATGAITVVTKTSSDFTDGMAKMSTLFDTSQVSIKNLSNEFLNLSNETGKSAVELTEAGYQALSASVPVENLGNFIKTSANMAKVGFTDTATSVDLLSTAVNAYGLSADQADNIANKLVNTQNLGKTSVNELASSMGKVIPTAAGMNVNLDQLCTMYTLMTKQGIATAESTTYMNSMLNELGDSGTDVGKIIKEKTGQSFQELMKDGQSTGDVLKILKDYSNDTGTAFNELWSSQEAGKAAMALLNDSAGDFNETMEGMANVADLVGQGLEKMDTPAAKATKAMNRIKNSGIELGAVLLTTLAPYIEKAASAVEKITTKFNDLPDSQKKVILILITLVAALGPVLTIGGKLISTFGQITSIAGKLASGFGKLWGVIAANPILFMVAAITALVAGFIYFWNTSESFRNFWIGLWDAIKDTVSSVVEAIKGFFEGLIDSILQIWESIKTGVTEKVNAIKDAISNVFSAIADVVSSAWETIKNIVTVGIMLIAEIISTYIQIVTAPWIFLWENCKEYILAAWEKIKELVSNALDAISNIISTAWNAIAAFLTPILNAIKNTISTVWDSIKSAVFTVLNAIQTVITTVWNAIKSIVTTVISAIKSVVSSGFSAIKSVITSILNAIIAVFSSIWNAIKSVVSSVISGIKSTISSGLHEALSVVSSILNSIKNKFSSILSSAANIVQSGIDKIKSFFNFSWSLPKLKLPHFSIEGEFSLNPPSVPHFGIDWYKKAMDTGMIMNQPTVFGYDAATNKLMAGGEAGSETVVGTDSLMSMIKNAVSESKGSDDRVTEVLEAIHYWLSNGGLEKLLIDILTQKVKLKWENRELARLVKEYA